MSQQKNVFDTWDNPAYSEKTLTKGQRVCSPIEREFIFNRDGHRCRYCGSTKPPFHVDHVYPYSRGGATEVNNLVTSCSRCNRHKHDSVGIWPKPIGYFNAHTPIPYFGLTAFVTSLVLLYNAIDIILNFGELMDIGRVFGFFGIVVGIFGAILIIKGR